MYKLYTACIYAILYIVAVLYIHQFDSSWYSFSLLPARKTPSTIPETEPQERLDARTYHKAKTIQNVLCETFWIHFCLDNTSMTKNRNIKNQLPNSLILLLGLDPWPLDPLDPPKFFKDFLFFKKF